MVLRRSCFTNVSDRAGIIEARTLQPRRCHECIECRDAGYRVTEELGEIGMA
jgi:hypothetical protein